MAKVPDSSRRGRAYPKTAFFIPFNLNKRHWSLLFVNLETKAQYIPNSLIQHADADLANKASSEVAFLRGNLVT